MLAFLASFAVSLIALVGIFTISQKHERIKQVSYFLVALAAGTLLGDAFFHLLPEAMEESDVNEIMLAILAGILFLFVFEKYVHWHHHDDECDECEEEKNKRVLYMTNLLGDGLHNLLDGIAIAAAFSISPVTGYSVTLAVILHEIPQEMADFGILIHAGLSKSKALIFNFISGLTSVLGVVMYLVLRDQLESYEPLILAFIAGVFLQISLSDLFVEIKESKGKIHDVVLFGMILTGLAVMDALRLLE